MVFLNQAESQNIYGNFEELLADVGQDSGSQVSDGFSFGNVIFQSGAVILNSSVKPLASYPIDGVYPTEKGEATQIVGTDGSAIGTITLAQNDGMLFDEMYGNGIAIANYGLSDVTAN